MAAVVIDASIASAWCFPDERRPYSQDVLNSLDRARAWVPSLWPLELANALLMGERRKRSTEADTIPPEPSSDSELVMEL